MKSGLSKPAVLRLSEALSNVIPNLNKASFEQDCLKNLEKLELKERVSHLISVLHQYLPENFTDASLILASIKPVWDYGDPEDPLRSFAAWPLVDYIAVYGIDHPDESLKLMKELTGLFSAEFAIRAFIIKYPEVCHEAFKEWIYDESPDVRRLVSEGTRPKLPWGIQLKCFVENPNINIPLLNELHNDSSLYVRRSVANHLNDIAKDHPQVVITACKEWLKTPTPNTDWVVKHATRTLVKAGNKDVFPLLGYTKKPIIKKTEFSLSQPKIKMGESISFTLSIQSHAKSIQNFVVDYAIHFVKANGKQQAKVFKCKNVKLTESEGISLTKTFSFKPITTRKYYPGEHAIEILINGESFAKLPFKVN